MSTREQPINRGDAVVDGFLASRYGVLPTETKSIPLSQRVGARTLSALSRLQDYLIPVDDAIVLSTADIHRLYGRRARVFGAGLIALASASALSGAAGSVILLHQASDESHARDVSAQIAEEHNLADCVEKDSTVSTTEAVRDCFDPTAGPLDFNGAAKYIEDQVAAGNI